MGNHQANIDLDSIQRLLLNKWESAWPKDSLMTHSAMRNASLDSASCSLRRSSLAASLSLVHCCDLGFDSTSSCARAIWVLPCRVLPEHANHIQGVCLSVKFQAAPKDGSTWRKGTLLGSLISQRALRPSIAAQLNQRNKQTICFCGSQESSCGVLWWQNLTGGKRRNTSTVPSFFPQIAES